MSRLIRLILFTVIGILFFLYLFYGENDVLPKVVADFSLYVVTILVSLLAGFGIDIINKRLNNKLGWRKGIFLRFSSGLVLNFAWVIIILLLAAWIGNLTQLVNIKIFEAEFINNELEIKLIVLSVLGLFIFNLVEFVTYS